AAALWQAANPVARDFRLEAIGPAYRRSALEERGDGVYIAKSPKPARGWVAYFIELTFPSGGLYPFKFTTGVRVAPDVLPFGPPPEMLGSFRALVWTALKSLHSSGVTSQNLIGCCRLSLRIVAWPTPALLTRMSITPKRPRALATISSIDSSRARSASIVIRSAPRCRCCAARASSARPWAVRSTAVTLSPFPRRPSTNSRPMPPAAPVTNATRCCSLIVYLPFLSIPRNPHASLNRSSRRGG